MTIKVSNDLCQLTHKSSTHVSVSTIITKIHTMARLDDVCLIFKNFDLSIKYQKNEKNPK